MEIAADIINPLATLMELNHPLALRLFSRQLRNSELDVFHPMLHQGAESEYVD